MTFIFSIQVNSFNDSLDLYPFWISVSVFNKDHLRIAKQKTPDTPFQSNPFRGNSLAITEIKFNR